MLALLLIFSARTNIVIPRDDYGVPHIQAANLSDAFFQAGYAVAQDRLWQMENSRRLARGRLAEVFGRAYLNSDKEVLATAYTDEELRDQFRRLKPGAKRILEAYVAGINAWIHEATPTSLPAGYAKHGFQPEPWSTLDSVAICIRLLQQFGRGGAGELRNLAMLAYLRGQKSLENRALDVWDDMAWWNDPDAVPTVSPSDDPLASTHVKFFQPNRTTTRSHLARLPKLGLFQLLPGIRVSSREESTRVAEDLSVPFHSGSYCVVVGASKSATGHPLLLSGPQMGMNVPSIAHEMSISAPGFATVGMDVPGIPGIIVGHTSTFAWGLTSGVADTDDIFFFPSEGSTYKAGVKKLPIQKITRTLRVKNGSDLTVEQDRTIDGPVVLSVANTLFSKRSSYWMREMDNFNAWVDLWTADSPDKINAAVDQAVLNFNFFYATKSDEIGWRYLGLVPRRAPGLDPRFPTPGEPEFAWQGMLSPREMPYVHNPKVGFLANWNNKPVAWWPNFDTPTWGKIFRNTALLETLNKSKLNAQDLELSAWSIARMDETWPYFKPYLELGKGTPGYEEIRGFDGRTVDGSRQASNYQAFINALRSEVFLRSTGSLLTPEYFNVVLQPSLLLRALERKTKFNYLGKRSTKQVVMAALAKVAEHPANPYRVGTFRSLDPTPIPYSNRGTYIQVVELLSNGIYGRNVLPPGVAESGPHSNDQSALARAWLYKAMSPY